MLSSVLSCVGTIPIYEHARMQPGLTVVAGLDAESGMLPSDHSMPGPPYLPNAVDRYAGGGGTVALNVGSHKAAFFITANAGTGAWLTSEGDTFGMAAAPLALDGQLGIKLALSDNSAVKLGVGFPGGLDIIALSDFGRHWTGFTGIGLRGITLGIAGHLPFGPSLTGHTSLGATFSPWAETMGGNWPDSWLGTPLAARFGFALGWQAAADTNR